VREAKRKHFKWADLFGEPEKVKSRKSLSYNATLQRTWKEEKVLTTYAVAFRWPLRINRATCCFDRQIADQAS